MLSRKMSESKEAVLAEISEGSVELKSVDSAADRSAPRIELDTKVGPAPAKEVFKELTEQGATLHKAQHVNDRSNPQVPTWPTELRKNPRPALVDEINKSTLIDEVVHGHRKMQIDGEMEEIQSKAGLVKELKSKGTAISDLTDKAARTVISQEGGYRSLVHCDVVHELLEKKHSIDAALTQLHRANSSEIVAN